MNDPIELANWEADEYGDRPAVEMVLGVKVYETIDAWSPIIESDAPAGGAT